MAMEAKIDFMREIEKTLANKVTVADMANIMSAITETLDGYDMRSVGK